MEKTLAQEAVELLRETKETLSALGGRVETLEKDYGKPEGDDQKVPIEALKDDVAILQRNFDDFEKRAGEVSLIVGPDGHERKVAEVVGAEALGDVQRLMARSFSRKQIIATAQWIQAKVLSGTSRWADRKGDLLTRMANISKAMGEEFRVFEQVKSGSVLESPIGKIALQEDTAAEGGDAIPTPFESTVLRLAEDNAVVRPMATKVPMTAKTHQVPALDTAPTAYIVPEETDMSASAVAWASGPFSQKNLTAKKIGTYTLVSGELAQDNAILLMQFLAIVFGEAIALLEDAQALEGDGTGNNFTGLFAASGVNAVAGGSNALTYGELVAAKWKGIKRATRRGAQWVFHPGIGEDIENLLDSQNRPIFSTNVGLSTTPLATDGFGEGRLMGPYPVWTSDQIAVNRGGGTNETTIYFGPFGNFHMIFGDLLGMEFATTDARHFETFQIDVRALKRLAILVGVPSAFTKITAVTT